MSFIPKLYQPYFAKATEGEESCATRAVVVDLWTEQQPRGAKMLDRTTSPTVAELQDKMWGLDYLGREIFVDTYRDPTTGTGNPAKADREWEKSVNATVWPPEVVEFCLKKIAEAAKK